MQFFTMASVFFTTLAAAQLEAVPIVKAIAPGSANCTAPAGDCRTAEQAAPYIADAMYEYGVFSTHEMAAVVSLMAFESGDFKYKHNVYPGRPGQGTANMQMAKYNLLYAKSIPEVAGKVAQYSSTEGMSDDQLNEVLALVTVDEYNFGSGPWFLTTQCPEGVGERLREDADAGFEAYMQCVGAAVTDDRLAYFKRAKQAFQIE